MDLNVLAVIKGRKERKRERREKERNQSKDVSVRWTASCLRKVCKVMYVMHAHSSASDMTLMIISVPTSQMPEVLTWRCPLLSSHKSQFFFVAITFFHILLSITAILLRWNPSVPFSHPPCPTTWWMELGGTRPFIWARLKPAD